MHEKMNMVVKKQLSSKLYSQYSTFPTENRRSSVDIFLKAAGYLDCAVRHVLPHLPIELRYLSC